MIDLNKMATLIATIPMQDAERTAVLKVIPRLSIRQLRALFELLRAEARALAGELAN